MFGDENSIMLFQQIRNAATGAYTYVLGDRNNRIGIVIDPVPENQDVLLALIGDLQLELHLLLLTHVHPAVDPCAVALRSRTGGVIVIGSGCNFPEADLQVTHGAHVMFGDEVIHVIGTPGYTRCSVSYRWRDRLFTGNTLLIGSCGGIALSGSDPGSLFDSVTNRLFALPQETLVFPGTDINGRTVSTIAEEKVSNPCFSGRSRASFVTLMSGTSPLPLLTRQSVSVQRHNMPGN